MAKNKNKIKNIKNLLTLIIVGVFLFVAVHPAQALGPVSGFALGAVGGAVAAIVGFISLIVVSVLGLFTTLLMALLVQVAQFSNIINVPTVIQGWVIVRDLCNMFFILILLIIAFATILRYEEYGAKKLLPKLLIMAVLINFSRTIFGLMIDFSQVVMLTFVNAFKDGGGNFTNLFQVNKWMTIGTGQDLAVQAVTQWQTVVSIILGLFAAIMTFIVVAVFLAVLVMRIVMLWIYTILSPLVFLGFAVPGIQKHTGQIWTDFTKLLVTGPMLAFFLWLALTTAANSSDIMGAGQTFTTDTQVCAGVGDLFCQGNFQKFLIVIGLLMGGLMVAQQAGGAVGKAASFGENWSKKGLKLGGAATLGTMAWGARKIKASKGSFGGLELNPMNIYRGVKEGFESKTRKDISDGKSNSADALKKGGGMGLIKGMGASKDMTEAMARGWFGAKGIKMAYQTYKAPGRRGELERLEEERDEIKKEYEKYDNHSKEVEKLEEKKNAGTATAGEKIKLGELRAAFGGALEVNRLKEKAKAGMETKNKGIIDYKEKNPIRTPYTFEANMERKKSVREAMSKIGDNDNSDDLVDMWRHAKASSDKELAAAVFLAAAKNGHSNEIIQAEKGIDEKNGFKGKVYDTNQNGLNAFVKEQLQGSLGMAEQEAFDYQSQFSSICKSVGHYMFAESITSKNGMLKQNDAKTQESHSGAEGRKVDAEKYTRDRNRFGYGYEQDDGEGNSDSRKFKFNRLGLTKVTENAAIISIEIDKERFNKNAAMKMLDDMETLKAYVKATGQTKFTVKGKDGTTTEDYDVLFKKMEAYGKAAKDSGKEENQSAADRVLNERDGKNTA